MILSRNACLSPFRANYRIPTVETRQNAWGCTAANPFYCLSLLHLNPSLVITSNWAMAGLSRTIFDDMKQFLLKLGRSFEQNLSSGTYQTHIPTYCSPTCFELIGFFNTNWSVRRLESITTVNHSLFIICWLRISFTSVLFPCHHATITRNDASPGKLQLLYPRRSTQLSSGAHLNLTKSTGQLTAAER